MLDRQPTALLDWFSPEGTAATYYAGEQNPEASVRARAGKFGTEAPDIEQSPVVFTTDNGPTHDWRSQNPAECWANTYIDDTCYKDRNAVDFLNRGEIAMGCPVDKMYGAKKAHGFPYPRITTNLNNLKKSVRLTYYGAVGNPSDKHGTMSVNRGRPSEDSLGTSNYGGGSLTTYNNSNRICKAGQQIFFLTEGTVSKHPETGRVMGNKWWYPGYITRDNQQLKILATVLPLTIDVVESIQETLVYHFESDLRANLSTKRIGSQLRAMDSYVSTVLTPYFNKTGLSQFVEATQWITVYLLRFALRRCWFYAHHGRPNAGVDANAYLQATNSFYRQLGETLQGIWREESERMIYDRQSYVPHTSASTLMRDYDARAPINMKPGAFAVDLTRLTGHTDDEDSQLNIAAALVLQLLERADADLVTIHNRMSAWFRDRWMGTVVSPSVVPGFTLKYISRN